MKKVFTPFHRSSKRTSCTFLLLLGLGFSPAMSYSFHSSATTAEWNKQQKISVSGIIYDQSSNTAISGVTIIADGKAIGTSNQNGEFSIQVDAGKPVSFQSLGFQTHSQQWNSDSKSVRINMTPSDESIQEVVVTALGIKREEKSLGYAV